MGLKISDRDIEVPEAGKVQLGLNQKPRLQVQAHYPKTTSVYLTYQDTFVILYIK
jgi:hypothetical protein